MTIDCLSVASLFDFLTSAGGQKDVNAAHQATVDSTVGHNRHFIPPKLFPGIKAAYSLTNNLMTTLNMLSQGFMYMGTLTILNTSYSLSMFEHGGHTELTLVTYGNWCLNSENIVSPRINVNPHTHKCTFIGIILVLWLHLEYHQGRIYFHPEDTSCM